MAKVTAKMLDELKAEVEKQETIMNDAAAKLAIVKAEFQAKASEYLGITQRKPPGRKPKTAVEFPPKEEEKGE